MQDLAVLWTWYKLQKEIWTLYVLQMGRRSEIAELLLLGDGLQGLSTSLTSPLSVNIDGNSEAV